MNLRFDKKVISQIVLIFLIICFVLCNAMYMMGQVEFKISEIGIHFSELFSNTSLKKILVLILFMMSLAIVLYNLGQLWCENKVKNEKILFAASLLFVGSIYLWIAIQLSPNSGPDEYMRYNLTYWIYKHGTLPIGNEKALIDSVWGVSYGYTPYLPSVISAVFMKIVVFITGDVTKLLLVARMTSVLSGVGVFCFAVKTGKLFFERIINSYLFAFLIALIPQFIFLCGYHNNDTMALMACMMILYSWFEGTKKHWGIKQTIMLAVAISICMLCYYNAYGYILCSILVCMVSVFRDSTIKAKWKFLLGRVIIVFCVVMLLAGWVFVRNAIIYDGDFIGFNASRECSEKYAQEQFKPSNRNTLANNGESIMEVIESEDWKENTVKSSIGIFGYMTIRMLEREYMRYILIFAVGWFLSIQYFMKNRDKRIWIIPFLLAIVIPIFLSMYYSYANDFQPQGRYSFPCVPILALLSAGGYECFMKDNEKWNRRINITMILLIIFSAVYLVGKYIVPNCFILV